MFSVIIDYLISAFTLFVILGRLSHVLLLFPVG